MPSKLELLQYLQNKYEEQQQKNKPLGWGDRLISPEVRGQQNSISQPGPGVEDPSVGEKLAMGGMALSNLPMTGASILLQKLQDKLFPAEPSITDSLIPDPLTGELKPTQKSESFMPYIGRNNPKIRAQYKKVFGFDPFEPIVVKRAQKEAGTNFKTSSGRGSVFMEGKPLWKENPKSFLSRSSYEDDGWADKTVGGDKVLAGVFSPQNPLIVKGSGSPGKPGLKALLGDPTNDYYSPTSINPVSTTSGKDYRAHNPKLEGRLKSHWFDKEKVLAEQAKRGGYDSAITVNTKGKLNPISEIMDFSTPTEHRLTTPTNDGSLATKNKVQLGVPGVERDKLLPKLENLPEFFPIETTTKSTMSKAKWEKISKLLPESERSKLQIYENGRGNITITRPTESQFRPYSGELADKSSKMHQLIRGIKNREHTKLSGGFTKSSELPIVQKLMSAPGISYAVTPRLRDGGVLHPLEYDSMKKFSPQDFLDLLHSMINKTPQD